MGKEKKLLTSREIKFRAWDKEQNMIVRLYEREVVL